MITAFKGGYLRKVIVVLLALALSLSSKGQDKSNSSANDVATAWPGVHYQVTQLQTIPGDRVLVVLRIYATSGVPQSGTFIGVEVPIPPGTPPAMIASGIFRPKAFSFDSATLKDDLTQQTLTALAPDPSGPRYLPAKLLVVLHANESQMMTLQFPMPPSPPPDSSGANNLPHTVSLYLPKATGPIKGLVLPSGPSPTGSQ